MSWKPIMFWMIWDVLDLANHIPINAIMTSLNILKVFIKFDLALQKFYIDLKA